MRSREIGAGIRLRIVDHRLRERTCFFQHHSEFAVDVNAVLAEAGW